MLLSWVELQSGWKSKITASVNGASVHGAHYHAYLLSCILVHLSMHGESTLEVGLFVFSRRLSVVQSWLGFWRFLLYLVRGFLNRLVPGVESGIIRYLHNRDSDSRLHLRKMTAINALTKPYSGLHPKDLLQ